MRLYMVFRLVCHKRCFSGSFIATKRSIAMTMTSLVDTVQKNVKRPVVINAKKADLGCTFAYAYSYAYAAKPTLAIRRKLIAFRRSAIAKFRSSTSKSVAFFHFCRIKWISFEFKSMAKVAMTKINVFIRTVLGGNFNADKALLDPRLSSSVSGKAQKFSRIGAREFVPYGKADLTIDGIKGACENHFKLILGNGFKCDILAGEQGPSCTTVSQIPNLKLIHVRFLKSANPALNDDAYSAIDDGSDDDEPRKSIRRKFIKFDASVSAAAIDDDMFGQPKTSAASNFKKPKLGSCSGSSTKEVPMSISISQMLNLGKVLSRQITVIEVFDFDFHAQMWSSVPQTIEMSIEDHKFAEGGFREAYKAVGTSPGVQEKMGCEEVQASTLDCIRQLGQTPEMQAKKCVQTNSLAQHFANLFRHSANNVTNIIFGSTFEYNDVFLCKLPSQEYATLERFVEGSFEKYVNNNGIIDHSNTSDISLKAAAFVHFSFEKSQRKLMVVDIQGCGYELLDPEIATTTLKENDEYLFCAGNLSTLAINNFTKGHNCNKFCEGLGLKTLSLFFI
eukprot:Seg1936.5 transcript_id=Seg1936.5/GoldUCD/mRNA.D3Y31 product="Eukaryotic elongation factor 2 kinase" protein_id=Seg1936.5/GoldUCD/D3Y31